MTRIDETGSNGGLSARTLACAAFTALLAFGSFSGPAAARWGDENDHRYDQGTGQRGDRDDHRDNRRDWDSDRWSAPPVVYERYAAPQYYAPPVFYSPGLDLNINIR